jgi:hypothetical protein
MTNFCIVVIASRIMLPCIRPFDLCSESLRDRNCVRDSSTEVPAGHTDSRPLTCSDKTNNSNPIHQTPSQYSPRSRPVARLPVFRPYLNLAVVSCHVPHHRIDACVAAAAQKVSLFTCCFAFLLIFASSDEVELSDAIEGTKLANASIVRGTGDLTHISDG